MLRITPTRIEVSEEDILEYIAHKKEMEERNGKKSSNGTREKELDQDKSKKEAHELEIKRRIGLE